VRLYDDSGLEIELTFDGDGFPSVNINTGGGFYAEHLRPTVEVQLNGVTIHEMFDEGLNLPGIHPPDLRWEPEHGSQTS
jgi:hypothetical protein